MTLGDCQESSTLYHRSSRYTIRFMTRFRVGDLVRVSKQDILRPGDAGIVRKVLDNPTDDESLQEYIVEFGDRKSTRLNSSHGYISYAVFCLKKKKTNKQM